jgi:hypothetical protein
MRPTSLKSVLDSLQDQGKIEISSGNMISNPRAVQEIETRSKVLEKWNENLSAADAKLREKPNVSKGNGHAPADAPAHPTARETQNQNKKERKNIRPAKKQDAGVYSEEFEALWQAYPRTRNTSKKKSWDLYRMLNEENRKKVHAAVPIFAAAMKAEGRPEDKIAHMTTWLNGRMYETAAAPAKPAGASNGAGGEWYRTATREQWERLLRIWRGNSNWSEKWGPQPGKPGCAVPSDLLTESDLRGW